MYPPVPQKPTGVSVLAILYFIAGVFWFIGAAVVFFIFSPLLIGDPTGSGLVLATLGAICSGVLGIIAFALGWGLWTLQPWAWTGAIIFAIIGLINFPIGTIISIIILIYLFRPEIKAAFRHGPPLVSPPAGGYPPYGPPPGTMAQPPPPPPPRSGVSDAATPGTGPGDVQELRGPLGSRGDLLSELRNEGAVDPVRRSAGLPDVSRADVRRGSLPLTCEVLPDGDGSPRARTDRQSDSSHRGVR